MKFFFTMLFMLGIFVVHAQINLDVEGAATISGQTAIGLTTADAKAKLHIYSRTSGLLIPRMTTLDRLTISASGTTPDGLLVYDINTKLFYYWNDGIGDWSRLPGDATPPQMLGYDPLTGELSISDGNSITLGDIDPTNETITGATLNGTMLEIVEGGNTTSVDLSTVSSPQTLGYDPLSGELSITDGNSITLGDVDPTNEAISGAVLNGTMLEISEGGNTTSVDLSAVSTADADWYQTAAPNPPGSISDDIYTNGRVGIGVNNPTTNLHVSGAARANNAIFGVATFNFTTNGSELRLIDWYDDNNSMLEFGKANSDGSTWYMNVTREGDGVSYPLDQTEMAFQIYNNKWKDYGTNITSGPTAPHLHLSRDTRRYIGVFTDTPTTQLDVDGQIRMRAGATDNYIVQGDADGLMHWVDPAAVFSEVDGSTTNETITGGTLNGTNLEIMEAGSTTSIDLSALSDEDHDWYTVNTTDSPTSISSSVYTEGSVGVGLSNPAVELHVKGEGAMLNLEGVAHAYMQYYKTGLANGRSAYLGFGSSGTNIFSIQNEMTGTSSDIVRIAAEDGIYVSNGNTATPFSTLDVNGQITMRSGATDGYILQGNANGTMSWVDPSTVLGGGSSLWTEDATNGEIYPMTLAQEVGIGTANPEAKLDIRSGVFTGAGDHVATNSFISHGSGSGTSNLTSIRGIATSNSWSATTNTIGVHGWASVQGTGNSPTHTAIGVKGEADAEAANGTQTAIGGYFTASGGDNNYAIQTDQGGVQFGHTSSGTLTTDTNGNVATRDMLKVPPRTTFPSAPEIGDIILYDDGTASPGNMSLKMYTAYGWLNIFQY